MIGKRIRLGGPESSEPWLTVVGVVPDLHVGGGVGGIGSDTENPEQLYLALAQNPARFLNIAIKTAGDPLAITPQVREAVADLDPNLPIYRVNTMDEVIERFTWAFGLFGGLFSIFGLLALFMAAVGLYGVMAFSVRKRTQEIGIRIALGADTLHVFRVVLGKGFMQLGVGILGGIGLGIALSRPLRFVLFDVDTSDISVYAAIVATLAVSGGLACVIPARRATKVDIVEALRPE